nr:zinc finger CCHC domain-containing protein 7-like [Drosophila kikkawai]
MVSLGNEIDLDEDELIEYMIAGIPDVNLRNIAKLQNFSTKTEMLEAFIQRNAQERKGTGKTQRRNVKCYNCNSLGHISSECRKPKREMGTCFACGKPGHQAKDCEQYKKIVVQNEYKHS